MYRKYYSLIIIALGLSLLFACGKSEESKAKKAISILPAKPTKTKYVTWAMWETDRAASIWLIKRYIDPKAEFVFIKKGDPLGDTISFDIPQAELQRKHNTACFQVIMRKYKLQEPELKELSKLVWDIEINFWGNKKYPESIPFKEKFDVIFEQKLPPTQTMRKCFVLFDKFVKNYKQKTNPEKKGKIITTSKHEANVGTFYKDETRTVEFKMKNKSNKKLRIKQVRKSCGCAKASAVPMIVAPGKSYTVTVTLTANKELYGPFIKSIYVTMYNSDIIKLSIIGNAKRNVKKK